MITTISFFKYSSNKFWAFTQMSEAHKYFNNNDNVKFYKLLGTGAGNGFLVPDLSTYALLAVWNSKKNAEIFYKKVSIQNLLEKKQNQEKIFI